MLDAKTAYLDGKEIDLKTAEATLSPSDLLRVEVIMSDGSRIRPFRFGSTITEIRTTDDGAILI